MMWLSLRYLRRRGTVARRAGRRGRGGNSQERQLLELADLGRDRAGDLVVVEGQALQLFELAELGRDRAGDGVPIEPHVQHLVLELADIGRDRAFETFPVKVHLRKVEPNAMAEEVHPTAG